MKTLRQDWEQIHKHILPQDYITDVTGEVLHVVGENKKYLKQAQESESRAKEEAECKWKKMLITQINNLDQANRLSELLPLVEQLFQLSILTDDERQQWRDYQNQIQTRIEEEYKIRPSFQPPKKVIMEKKAYDDLIKLYERRMGMKDAHPEWCGVMLGWIDDSTAYCTCVIFPPQAKQTRTWCEFDGGELARMRTILEKANQQVASPKSFRLMWIHTHPALGFFFSSTDIATFKMWTAFDKSVVAIVVDPLQRQFKAFNSEYEYNSFKAISMEIGNIPTTERDYFFFYYFKDELEKFYYNGNFG